MFSQYGYLLYQVERSKSPGELRAEDASRGEAAASLWRRWAKLSAALGTPYHRGRATTADGSLRALFCRPK